MDPTLSPTTDTTTQPTTDLSSLIGTRASASDPKVTEYFNKQSGIGFDNPQDLANFVGVETGQNNVTATNVFDYLNNATNSLNQGQTDALDSLNGSPTTDYAAQIQKAQDIIDRATTDQASVQQQLKDATTGANDLRTQTQGYYDKLGIPQLQDQIEQAQKDYDAVKQQSLDNRFQIEDQYAGGGTEGFASTLDERQQRVLAMHELAAGTALTVAQQRLNSNMDAFKVFTGEANQQQSNTIQTLSQQLGLDKSDLQFGVSMLNQIQQEVHGDETAARQFVATLAANNPDVFSQLTPQDKIDLSAGRVTPSILTKIGAAANLRQQRLDIQQQQANISMSKAFGQSYGLSQYGVANGTTTQQASYQTQQLDIARQRLQIYASRALGGGVGTGDAITIAQQMANSTGSIDMIPPALRGYFTVKTNYDGTTSLTPKVTKAQAASFTSAYNTWVQKNSSATYQPNVVPQDKGVYDVKSVAGIITQALTQGMGYADIRAKMQALGVPLTVYQAAIKSTITI